MTPTETVLEEFAIPVSLYSIVEDMANEIVTLRICHAERKIWQHRAQSRIALQAENDGLRAELDKAVKALPSDDAERFICLAHPHNNRWEEALCSAKYQLDAAVRERDAYMANYKNAVRFMESVRGGALK